MNENVIVKEYEFDKPLIQKIGSRIDKCIRDCHNKCFHIFDHICVNDITFTNIAINETFNLTISDKNMSLYELNKKIKNARQNGFIFNQINKVTLQTYSNLSKMKIQYYLKLRIPIMHRHFFMKLSQNLEYVRRFCNDKTNPFQYAIRDWTDTDMNEDGMIEYFSFL